MSKPLIALLAELAGMQGDALASCVNDDGSVNAEAVDTLAPKIKESYQAKLKKAREDAAAEAQKEVSKKGTFDDGFKKGEAKGYERSEERIVKMLGQAADGKSGDELYDQLAETLKGEKRKEITADDVERNPHFQASINKLKQQHKEELEKVKGEHTEKEKGWQRKETIAELRKRVMPMLKELNLNISDDEAVRERRLEMLFDQIVHNREFEIKGDDVTIMVDGKVFKDDKTLDQVQLKDLVTNVATSHYDTMASKPKDSPGVDNTGKPKPASKWTDPLPKSDEEYQKLMTDESLTLEKKTALRDTWKAQKAA